MMSGAKTRDGRQGHMVSVEAGTRTRGGGGQKLMTKGPLPARLSLENEKGCGAHCVFL